MHFKHSIKPFRKTQFFAKRFFFGTFFFLKKESTRTPFSSTSTHEKRSFSPKGFSSVPSFSLKKKEHRSPRTPRTRLIFP